MNTRSVSAKHGQDAEAEVKTETEEENEVEQSVASPHN